MVAGSRAITIQGRAARSEAGSERRGSVVSEQVDDAVFWAEQQRVWREGSMGERMTTVVAWLIAVPFVLGCWFAAMTLVSFALRAVVQSITE